MHDLIQGNERSKGYDNIRVAILNLKERMWRECG